MFYVVWILIKIRWYLRIPPNTQTGEQVLGTPQSLNFLHLLQSLVLLERGSAQAEVIWTLLEELVQAAVLISDKEHTERFLNTGISRISEAVKSKGIE